VIIIEIPSNPNCEAVEMRVFHDVAAAQHVTHARLEHETGKSAWYEVTGWTVAGKPSPALAQKVDDSGEGIAFLLYGGDAGLRFRPSFPQAAWSLDDPTQWGEPFRIISDINELKIV